MGNTTSNILNSVYNYDFDGFEETSNTRATKIIKFVKQLDKDYFQGVNSKNFTFENILYAIDLFKNLKGAKTIDQIDALNFALDYVLEEYNGTHTPIMQGGKFVQWRLCPICRSKAIEKTNGELSQVKCIVCDCKSEIVPNERLNAAWDYQKDMIAKFA